MFRYELYNELRKFDISLDLLIRLIATNMGYVHYINKKMSAYRTENSQSASGVLQNSEQKLFDEFYKLHCSILDEFDEYTNFQYHEEILKQEELNKLTVCASTLNLKKMKDSSEYKNLKKMYIAKILVKKYLSGLFNLIKILKTKMYQGTRGENKI